MPHIVYTTQVDVVRFYESFEPRKAESSGWLIKLGQCFLSHHKDTAIVDCTAVRSGFSQDFYLRLENKKGKTTVRVDPYMRIERNEGVQRTIALVGGICSSLESLEIHKTNLPDDYFTNGPAVEDNRS